MGGAADRHADPPTGIRATRFFIIFDVLVALAILDQVWVLVEWARRRPPASTPRAIAPLAWELVAAPLILNGYPSVMGGLGWGRRSRSSQTSG